jgi:predicted dehydrogenase
MDVQEDALRKGHRPVQDIYWGVEPESQWGTLHMENGNERIKTETGDYRDYYMELHVAIVSGQAPPITAEDGLKTIRIIEYAFESARLGKRLSIK